VLASVDRRAQLQVRQTVEGLSVAAITYYPVGLVGCAAKALKSAGAWSIEPIWPWATPCRWRRRLSRLVCTGAPRQRAKAG
jgi:uncharacterized membrane-anchored protein